MKRFILLVDDSVYKFIPFKKLFEADKDVRVFSCLNEEKVIGIIKSCSVDVIILDPVLPTSFLRQGRGDIKKTENGEVGLILVKNIMKKLVRADKKPVIIFNTHLSPEHLTKTGFKNVKGNHLPKTDKPYLLVDILEKKFEMA